MSHLDYMASSGPCSPLYHLSPLATCAIAHQALPPNEPSRGPRILVTPAFPAIQAGPSCKSLCALLQPEKTLKNRTREADCRGSPWGCCSGVSGVQDPSALRLVAFDQQLAELISWRSKPGRKGAIQDTGDLNTCLRPIQLNELVSLSRPQSRQVSPPRKKQSSKKSLVHEHWGGGVGNKVTKNVP